MIGNVDICPACNYQGSCSELGYQLQKLLHRRLTWVWGEMCLLLLCSEGAGSRRTFKLRFPWDTLKLFHSLLLWVRTYSTCLLHVSHCLSLPRGYDFIKHFKNALLFSIHEEQRMNFIWWILAIIFDTPPKTFSVKARSNVHRGLKNMSFVLHILVILFVF